MPAIVKTKADEALWKEAKAQAEKQGKTKRWGYVVSIYQNMKGNKDKGAKK